ncbi:hypothetical protein BDR06DRAFT_1012491 [Suillus hirtellus]|nr:hypothetical protein BDR06DRAFT_1012491 [Suillus hirtellus]
MAWKIQDHLPLGATQVPIILGSDKTPVTQLAGGIEMHPVFVTIGNIDSEVCSKATLRAWCCIAYIPVIKFCIHTDYQSILQARLWHKCLDLVFTNLKVAAKDGCFMPDPSCYIRHVFMPLVTHVCDLPEATMIAAVSKNSSPLTMATQVDFGDGILHLPHTRKYTLQLIVEISQQVDPWDLDKFQKVAKAINLSGVHMPYWLFRGPSAEMDQEALGDYELDTHFMVQHKRVRMRHFAKGITHVNQMTGRKYRDIQCAIIASIAGAVPPRFVCTICALVDFFYLAQNPVHSPESLQLMVQALLYFHACKDAIIQAKARKGKKGVKEDFFIPKLKLLQSFNGTIQKLGTLMQFSIDVMEWLLITHCKDLFPQTSQQIKDFTEQCVWILNRQESMEMFGLYMLLTSRGVSLVNAIYAKDEDVTIANPALSWVS